ncbi:MAG: ABC transporter ATP-binding protein [Chloroflexota bacterium]|nr:ABC transporter ATP-binding protein [Chloroflexota bacterium]
MTEPIIYVSDLRKSYGEVKAVDGVSFQVFPGEIFGLLGPNGAGKTTTLESLEGLRKPDSGTIRIAGVEPGSDTRTLRNVIGVQLQSAGMPESITPDEAMRLFCAYHGVEPRYDLLERLGLAGKRKAQFHQLSTGQQRRLALALAVAHQPPVLFLDEPTAGLDVPSRMELHSMIQELKQNGTTIVLATHDMAEAEEMADRVAILLEGRIVASGTPMEITATGAGLTKISVRTRASVLMAGQNGIPAVSQSHIEEPYKVYFSTDVASTVASIITTIEEKSDELIDLRVERPSLEDRFLELTANGQRR